MLRFGGFEVALSKHRQPEGKQFRPSRMEIEACIFFSIEYVDFALFVSVGLRDD
jgi:hypothetical protein